MAVPFLNVKPKAIKLKVLPQFPANVYGRTGINVVKENGNWYADLDYSEFGVLAALPSEATYTLIYNPVSGSYSQVPLSLVGGGIGEAPIDGSLYGRKDAAWTVVPETGTPSNAVPQMNGIGAAGASGQYSRADHVHPTDTTRAPLSSPNFTDAPTTPSPLPGDNSNRIANTAWVTANIFPAGTRMLFVQTAAPTGWTKDTTHNDKALRIVSGAASSGGTNAFSTVMAQTTVGGTALSIAHMPPHDHGYVAPTATVQAETFATGVVFAAGPSVNSTTGPSGSGAAHSHTITMAMQYVDAIIAVKS